MSRNGHDLFYAMETGCYPFEQSYGFCRINVDKYNRRAGQKTKDPTEDLLKRDTYQHELRKLVELHVQGRI